MVPAIISVCFLSLPLEMEPFDEALDRRIWSLSDQRLKWDREIASKRRTRPQEIEASLEDVLDQQQVLDEVPNSGREDTEKYHEFELDRESTNYTIPPMNSESPVSV